MNRRLEAGGGSLEKATPEGRMRRKVIKSFRDLEVYQLSYQLAMEILRVTNKFPSEEIYSLARQLRNSSRSVPGNIAEGWSKRRYENVFKRHLTDAMGSADETTVWLDMAKDSDYMRDKEHKDFIRRYSSVGAMLYKLINNWRTFK
jgi:four helix bundle protein